jgi:hypothetical protein
MKDKLYYKDGTTSDKTIFSKVLHREDGPAVEYASGSRDWYLNGKLHREDGPAVELADGSKAWWLNGKLHREDGPAIEYADGFKRWHLNDEQLFTLTKEHLIKYMEANNLTVAHLFTDSDEVVRTSASKYDWEKV